MKTLEEMDELFGAKTTSKERDNIKRIRRELGMSLAQETQEA